MESNIMDLYKDQIYFFIYLYNLSSSVQNWEVVQYADDTTLSHPRNLIGDQSFELVP